MAWKTYEDASYTEVALTTSYTTMFTLAHGAKLLDLKCYQKNDEAAAHDLYVEIDNDDQASTPQHQSADSEEDFAVYYTSTAPADDKGFVTNLHAAAEVTVQSYIAGTIDDNIRFTPEGHTITVRAKVDAAGTNQVFGYKRIYQLLEAL